MVIIQLNNDVAISKSTTAGQRVNQKGCHYDVDKTSSESGTMRLPSPSWQVVDHVTKLTNGPHAADQVVVTMSTVGHHTVNYWGFRHCVD